MRAAAVRAVVAAGAALALTLLLTPVARGEGWLDRAGFGAIEEFARSEAGFDARAFLEALLSGDPSGAADGFQAALEALVGQIRGALTGVFSELLPPVLLCAVLKLVQGRRSGPLTGMSELVCALCCGLVLAGRFTQAQAEVEGLLDRTRRAAQALTPVLVSACALTGASATASLWTPLSAECGAILQFALSDWGLRLCRTAGAVALAGSLSRRFPLDRLFGLMRSMVRWLLGASMLLAGGLVSAQGMLGASRDSAALHVAKTALENLVPVIGGGVSDSAGALAVTAGALRQAVGLTGVAVVLCAGAAPIMRLAAATLSVRLSAALLEPLAEGAPSMLIGRFGELLELLLAIGISGAVMAALLAGGCALCLGSLGA